MKSDVETFTMGIASEFPAVLGAGLPVLMLPVLPMIGSPKEKVLKQTPHPLRAHVSHPALNAEQPPSELQVLPAERGKLARPESNRNPRVYLRQPE